MPQQLMIIRSGEAVDLTVVLVILQVVCARGFPLRALSLVCCTMAKS